jgi:hypothetical protein
MITVWIKRLFPSQNFFRTNKISIIYMLNWNLSHSICWQRPLITSSKLTHKIYNFCLFWEIPALENVLARKTLMFWVSDYDKLGSNDVIGRCVLGCNASGAELR